MSEAPPRLRVVVPHGRFVAALAATGADVAVAPLTRTTALAVDPAELDPRGAAWVLVTSVRTVARLRDVTVGGTSWPETVATARERGTRVGSVGPATTSALAEVGIGVDVEASAGTAVTLVAELGLPGAPDLRRDRNPPRDPAPIGTTDPSTGPSTGGTGSRVSGARPRVLLPASALADPRTAAALTARGWDVASIPVYTTTTTDDPAPARAALMPWPDVVVVTAPSILRALLEVAGTPPPSTALVAIGPTTADAIRSAGLTVAAEASAPTPEAVASAVAARLTARSLVPDAPANPSTDHAHPTAADPTDPSPGVGPRRTS